MFKSLHKNVLQCFSLLLHDTIFILNRIVNIKFLKFYLFSLKNVKIAKSNFNKTNTFIEQINFLNTTYDFTFDIAFEKKAKIVCYRL